ncbi:MAG: molybdenum cofactor guanylyltransferase MobA [Rudaea sp.]
MPFNRASVTAAILAGGEGQRVSGKDKGLLPLASLPLIAHVLVALREQVGAIVICANRNADEYARFAPVIADGLPGFHGPLAGVTSALAYCATPWLLTVPVDCPQPPPDLAMRLHAALHAQNRDLAVVWDGTRTQPLFALYRTTLAASAKKALLQNLPVWNWQESLHVARADFSDLDDNFVNLNTPNDFHIWENARHD